MNRVRCLRTALFVLLSLTAGAGPATAGPIDPASSWVVAVTAKAGALGFLGHEHAILVTDWKGNVDWNPAKPSSSRARITAPSAGLEIDSQRGRQLAGLSGGPDASTVKKLQVKMLDSEHLAADAHPEITFEVTGVEGDNGKQLTMVGALTLRGKTQTVRFPVEVSENGQGETRFRGSFTVKHSAFGMKPESVAGVVNVADEVSVRFQITTGKR